MNKIIGLLHTICYVIVFELRERTRRGFFIYLDSFKCLEVAYKKYKNILPCQDSKLSGFNTVNTNVVKRRIFVTYSDNKYIFQQ